MTTAAVYVRISQDREGAGVARQEEDCVALCKRKGWRVADTVVVERVDVNPSNPRKRWDPDRFYPVWRA